MRVHVSDIIVGNRHRKNMGDVAGLADSITDVGLLHPIVLKPDMTLVVGARRLAAVKHLGWSHVEANVVKNLDDAYRLLRAERDENDQRQDHTPLEDHALYQDLLEAERVFAKERQAAAGERGKEGGRGKKKTHPRNAGKGKHGGESGRRAAKATGRSEKTHRKIEEVVKAAEEDASLASVVEEMERTGKVDGAHRKVKQKKAKDAKRAEAVAAPNRPTIATCKAIDWLARVAPRSFDLLITDPPYSTDVPDVTVFANEWVPAALRALKRSARAYICTGAYPIELRAYLDVLLKQDAFTVANVLVWTYRNTLGPSPKLDYKLNWQAIFYLRGPEAPALNCPEMVEQFSVQDINAPDGRQGNRDHAWQKPDELAERLVRHGSKKGDLVIDPFAGTGTFLLAASRLGRSACGCDRDPDMVRLAVERGCANAQ